MQCRELKTDFVAYGPLERAWQYRRASQSAQVTHGIALRTGAGCLRLRWTEERRRREAAQPNCESIRADFRRWGIYARVI